MSQGRELWYIQCKQRGKPERAKNAYETGSKVVFCNMAARGAKGEWRIEKQCQ